MNFHVNELRMKETQTCEKCVHELVEKKIIKNVLY
jgi:hypothetical protein